MPLNYSLLIVEDNEDLLEDYTGWFIRCGYDVTAAHHPRQAIEAVTFNKFRVAVMDCNLPDISGIELMQQLKRLTDIEVIIVSGHNAAEREAIEGERTRGSGMVDGELGRRRKDVHERRVVEAGDDTVRDRERHVVERGPVHIYACDGKGTAIAIEGGGGAIGYDELARGRHRPVDGNGPDIGERGC